VTPVPAPAPTFDHLLRMTDAQGTFEHARFSQPRHEHGYCTDDMARVLVVATREANADQGVRNLAAVSLRFLRHAQSIEGRFRNRMNRNGRWDDQPAVDDCWGRSVWGLGTAAARSDRASIREHATRQLERAARQRSAWPRATAFAALGAAELLAAQPDNATARALLVDAAHTLGRLGDPGPWPWPEARLSYANAVLPEAMIAAGSVLDQPALLQRGLELLGWLLEHETHGGHVSVTPVGGAGPGDHGPAFDQQPIEVAALADACARAAVVDDSSCWVTGLAAMTNWFMGDNDSDAVMWDPASGAGYDGLQPDGPNLNQGTESTLALLSTLQHAQRLTAVPQ
jgi:hypothetical protein